MTLAAVMRVLVVGVMGYLMHVHYQAGEWWLLAGDFLVTLLIGGNWAYGFVVARLRTRNKPPK